MGTLLKKLGIKSSVKNLSGKGGMSFFLDDPKEAKKLKKELEKRIKDVRIINLDRKAGDESEYVVYARLFEGKINEAQEPLWTKDTVKDAIKQIKKGLKNAVPYLDDIGPSTLGGEHRISIIGKISLDKKNTWANGILHNSRWGLIHFFPDGTLDTIRMSGWGSYEERKKVPILRKSKNKTLIQAIDRMGKYFTVVRTKYPVKGK